MDRETLLKIVNKSPAAIKANSQDDWVAIFDPKGLVNDPVGTPIHQNHESLRRFHNCFINRNDIVFNLKKDLVDVEACRVTRVAELIIGFEKTKFGMIQPLHIIYDIDPKTKLVKSLRAIWEVRHARIRGTTPFQLLMSSLMMTYNFILILYSFGIVFTLQYIYGLMVGAVSGGKNLMRHLRTLCESEQTDTITSMFFRPESSCVRFGNGFIRPEGMGELLSDTVKFEVVDPEKSAGWKTTMYYRRTTKKGASKLGLIVLDVCWDNIFKSAVESAYIYEEDEFDRTAASTQRRM